jgi:hypothetical protein
MYDPHPTVMAELCCVACGDAWYADLGPRIDANAEAAIAANIARQNEEFTQLDAPCPQPKKLLYCRSCKRPDVQILGWAGDLEADCACLIDIARAPNDPARKDLPRSA